LPIFTVATPVVSGPRFEIHVEGECSSVVYDWKGASVAPPRNDDFALVGALSIAMQRGGALHVRGRVDRRLLANAEKFAELWSSYRPDLFRPVRLSADVELAAEAPREEEGYAFALSGGVDGLFALARNIAQGDGRTNRRPAAAFFMDWDDALPISPAWAESLRRRTGRLASAFGLPHLVCTTNWRDFCRDFSIEHALGIIAAGHCLNGGFTGCVLAADHTHRNEVALGPWGNNHTSNPLLSSSIFETISFGGAFERLEKVRFLAKHPELVADLAVCTRASGAENCGICEKCIRTGLELFLATGSPQPVLRALPSPLSLITRKPLTPSSACFWQRIHANWPQENPWIRSAISVWLLRSALQQTPLFKGLQSLERRVSHWARGARRPSPLHSESLAP